MTTPYPQALELLKQALVEGPSYEDYVSIVGARDDVLARFGALFTRERVATLREDEFRAFLDLKNNRHWSGLHRMGPRICRDMPRLRAALDVLLDEGRPIDARVDHAVERISGMGKAIVTAVLHVARPDTYGVWNTTSEGGLKHLGLWPRFERGTTLGQKYAQVNDILVRLAADLDIDLWTLDALLWVPVDPDEQPAPVRGAAGPSDSVEVAAADDDDGAVSGQSFALESHLQRFLWDNWDQTELFRDWEVYTEPGDDERGYEYPCDVGRIDILARSHDGKRWLVVELKRGRTSDQTVGQVLRYMGWIKHELAAPGESVEGLVIAHDNDDRLAYALEMVPSVTLRHYEVSFRLKAPRRSR